MKQNILLRRQDLHRFYVELRTVQLLLSLSLTVHAAQVTLALELSDSSPDLNEHVTMLFCSSIYYIQQRQ